MINSILSEELLANVYGGNIIEVFYKFAIDTANSKYKKDDRLKIVKEFFINIGLFSTLQNLSDQEISQICSPFLFLVDLAKHHSNKKLVQMMQEDQFKDFVFACDITLSFNEQNQEKMYLSKNAVDILTIILGFSGDMLELYKKFENDLSLSPEEKEAQEDLKNVTLKSLKNPDVISCLAFDMIKEGMTKSEAFQILDSQGYETNVLIRKSKQKSTHKSTKSVVPSH